MSNLGMPVEDLLWSQNYRSFLRHYIDWLQRHGKTNFSDISRRSGFSSRSFLKEVIAGQKRLTAQSVGKLRKGLKLTSAWAQLFECLVIIEEPKANVQGATKEELLEQLSKIRQKILRSSRATVAMSPDARDKVYLNRFVSEVYASLGTLEKGASLNEIKRRSGLEEHQIHPVLSHLIEFDLISNNEGRYFVKRTDVDLFGLGSSISFKKAYLMALSQLSHRATESMSNDTTLFFHSAFSVSHQKLPKLKSRLRETILEFLDEEQNDDGDKVCKLTLGFYV